VVFIDQFNLPEEDIKNGYSQKIFTEQLVSNVKSIAIENIDKNHLETEVSNCSINRFSLKETIKNIISSLSEDVANNINNSIDTDWGHININIQEYGIPIRDFVNRLFSRDIIIGGDVVKENDEYLIQISSKFSDTNSTYSSQYKAKNITDAKIKAAESILKYAYPAIFAIRNIDSPKDAEDAINIAKINHYTDNEKFISLLDTLLGFIILYDQSQTSKTDVVSQSRDYFEKALARDKSNIMAMMGDIAVNFYIFQHLERSPNLFQKMHENAKNNTISKAESLLLSINYKDDRMLSYAYSLLATIYESMGRKDKTEDVWKNALAKIKELAEKDISNEDILNILFEYAMFKIRQNDYRTADLLLETMYTYKLDGEDENRLIEGMRNKIDYRYNLGKAMLIMSETGNIEKTEEYTQLLKLYGNPCALASWAYYLYDRAKEEKDSNIASYLLRRSNSFFAYAERNGMRGFEFYNHWLNLLGSSLGTLEQSIEKYHKALNYNGPHSWAFLNIGNKFYAIGKYKEAENKFRESLENSITTNGVKGYLYSIYSQEDYQRFLEEYDKYDIYVKSDDRIKLLVGFSYCMLNDHVMADKFLIYIQNINAISNDDRESLRSCINNIQLNKPHQSQAGQVD